VVTNFLVTGAGGFVGQAFCLAIGSNANTRAAVRTSCSVSNAQQIVVGEVDGCTDWSTALKNVDVIVHLAARTHVTKEAAFDPLAEYRRTNVAGTSNLASQAVRAGVKRFVFVSSVKVNGEVSPEGQPFVESDAPAPEDHYGRSKHEAEMALRRIADENGMEWVVVRPPLVYGPGVKANFASLVSAVCRGIPLPLGAVDNRRSLIGLGNLVDFLAKCAVLPEAARHTFLVSDDDDLSTPELVVRLAFAVGTEPRLFPLPLSVLKVGARLLGRQAAIRRLCGNLQVDISLARSALGWKPPFTVEDELRKTVAGIKK
jgi:nucleoside-diphosphate-sugar epimerase